MQALGDDECSGIASLSHVFFEILLMMMTKTMMMIIGISATTVRFLHFSGRMNVQASRAVRRSEITEFGSGLSLSTKQVECVRFVRSSQSRQVRSGLELSFSPRTQTSLTL